MAVTTNIVAEAGIAGRVRAVQEWLRQHELAGWMVPREDEYLGEQVPERNQRLAWVSGFEGSAGLAVVTRDAAAIFLDRRYSVRARQEVSQDVFEICEVPVGSSLGAAALEWLRSALPDGGRVGYDARLCRASWLSGIREADLNGTLRLTACEENPVDALWRERPECPETPVRLMDADTAGESSHERRRKLGSTLRELGAEACPITKLDNIAWLLNIRGEDIPMFPVALCSAILHADGGVDLYINRGRLPGEFAEHAGADVRVHDPAELGEGLRSLSGKTVLFDRDSNSAWTLQTLTKAGAEIVDGKCPCRAAQAVKNAAEVAGMRECHVVDGVAMCKFLAWVDRQVAAGARLDEKVLAEALWKFRAEDARCLSPSFDTISAIGPSAAKGHYDYRVNEPPVARDGDSLYLVDSGGQYANGTTDITRTVVLGAAQDEWRKMFTLVLKGHIALASARFPAGTTGIRLESLARQPLWAHGFDYHHGTGHGVGHNLAVHEFPPSFSKTGEQVPLVSGMTITNEPGFYREGEFGIRLENVMLVVEADLPGDKTMFGFEALTMAPIDRRLVDMDLMKAAELDWLDAYHKDVYETIAPSLSGDDLAWLERVTEPIERAAQRGVQKVDRVLDSHVHGSFLQLGFFSWIDGGAGYRTRFFHPLKYFVLHPWHFLLLYLAGWINREQERVIAYLKTENSVLREKLGKKRILLNDEQRRRLAIKGKILGRKRLAAVGCIVTPDTILRWHRQLVACKWTYAQKQSRLGRPRVRPEIVDLTVRFARENMDWGYDKIQGALNNVGYVISESTVGNILKAHGIEPAPLRGQRTAWKTFLKAHWDTVAAIDFTTVEVWTTNGLVTYYVLVAMHLKTRTVEIAGITTSPTGEWVRQIGRNLTDEFDGFLIDARYLLMDRDTKFSPLREFLRYTDVETVLLPPRSPNLNAHLERFMLTLKSECINKFVFFGEKSLRRAISEFVAHYHGERNHQGIGNTIIRPGPEVGRDTGEIQCRERLGGMLRYYHREAA